VDGVAEWSVGWPVAADERRDAWMHGPHARPSARAGLACAQQVPERRSLAGRQFELHRSREPLLAGRVALAEIVGALGAPCVRTRGQMFREIAPVVGLISRHALERPAVTSRVTATPSSDGSLPHVPRLLEPGLCPRCSPTVTMSSRSPRTAVVGAAGEAAAD